MRQITRWLAKMDAGNFLGSLTDRELEQWRVHVRNNHQPYHRNCKTCVESSGTGRRHVKIKTPSSYCLSLDVCGPFRQRGVDPDHADYRFALIGAYVIPKLQGEVRDGGPHRGEVRDGGAHGSEVRDGGPHEGEVRDGGPHEAKYEMGVHTKAKYEMGVHTKAKYEMGVHTEAKYEMGVQMTAARSLVITAYQSMVETLNQRSWRTRVGSWRDGELVDDEATPALSTEEKLKLPAGMTMEEFNEVFSQVGGVEGYQVIYLASPLRTRTTKDVLFAVQDLYLRLRAQDAQW